MRSSRLLRSLGFVLLLGFGPPALADRLSELPVSWQPQLQALPETDTGGAEPAVKAALETTRSELNALLGEPGSSATELAAAFGQLGNLYQLYEIHTLADICYGNAGVLEPDNVRWPYYRAYLALVDGRIRQAIEGFERVQQLDPDYPVLPLRLGQAWYEANEMAKARPQLLEAAGVPGLRAAASYYLGQMALLERDYAAAQQYLQEVLVIDPLASRAHYPLARAWRGLGETDQARRHLALKGDREPQVEDPLLAELNALRRGARPAYIKAMKAVQQGGYDQAVGLFREGLNRDPGNLNARVSLARALYLSGRPDQARRELEGVIKAQPNHLLALFLMGVLVDLEDAASEAASYYERVLERDPRHAGAHFFLANQLLKQGQFRAAAKAYESAVLSGSENPFAGLYRLVALHHAGEPDGRILQLLKQELGRRPEFPMLEYARVRLLALSRDPVVSDPAAALSRARALAMSAPFPPYLEALALALAATGDWEQALGLLESAGAGAPGMGFGPMQPRASSILDAIREKRLPRDPWPPADPLLHPGPVDAMAVFREYPSAVPF